MRAAVIALAIIFTLSGCAASVKKTGEDQLSIHSDAKRSIIVDVRGSEWVQSNSEWLKFRAAWLTALREEAAAAGVKYSDLGKAKRLNPYPATFVDIDVSNFRYISKDERYGLGVMVGNAWINSRVSFIDWQSRDLIASRKYDTSSSAWEGVFSAMTKEQIQAISKEIISEIRSAREVTDTRLPAVPARDQSSPENHATKEQQIQQLQNETGLSYEEYQRRYRQIMAQ